MFTGICILNAIYVFFFVYETKGKSLDEILKHYGAPDNSEVKNEKTGKINMVFCAQEDGVSLEKNDEKMKS